MGYQKMNLEQTNKIGPPKLNLWVLLIIFLFLIFLFIWDAYSPTKISYKRQEIVILVSIYTIYQLLLVKIEEDRFLEFFERGSLENFFYIKNPSFVNFLLLSSSANIYAFLFYFGYKTVWYYPILLFLLGSYFNGLFLLHIIKKFRTIKDIVTLSQFFLLPVLGVLLWYLV